VIILRAQPKPLETVAPAPVATPVPALIPAPAPVTAPARLPAVVPTSAPVTPLAQPLQPCPRPFAQPDLVLQMSAQQGGDAARDFNRTLRRKLAARRGSVTVDLAQSYAADASPPAALVPWLGRIKASGGAVRMVQYCQKGRGLFGFLRRAFSSDASSDYAVAETYDALQHVDGITQTVTQIEFRPREPAK